MSKVILKDAVLGIGSVNNEQKQTKLRKNKTYP